MHPDKVKRESTKTLTDLPNIGPAIAKDLQRIGIERPEQLVGSNPLELYARLCEKAGKRQDPCLLDVLMSIVHFMDGGDAQVWWAFTSERKRLENKK